MENKYKRDSERRLIKAVNRIIEEDGFSKVRINHIARVAECDKVLIYRYFGGLEGLLSAWAKENDYYTAALDLFMSEAQNANKDQIRELTKKVLLSQLHFLQENRVMQELIIWELTGQSKFKTVKDIREQNGYKLQQVLTNIAGVENKDINLYITVLVTSIELIVLKTREYPLFNGVDFSRSESWSKYETVLTNYVDMLFDTLDL